MGWHAGTLISHEYVGCILKPFYLFSTSHNRTVADLILLASSHRTYTCAPIPSLVLIILKNPDVLVMPRLQSYSEDAVKLYPCPRPKMQPCTHKNKQWPSLSSVARAMLSWRPGLIFNLADFLWAEHPPPLSYSYVCVSSTAERLWSCSDHREQRLTDQPLHSKLTLCF